VPDAPLSAAATDILSVVTSASIWLLKNFINLRVEFSRSLSARRQCCSDRRRLSEASRSLGSFIAYEIVTCRNVRSLEFLDRVRFYLRKIFFSLLGKRVLIEMIQGIALSLECALHQIEVEPFFRSRGAILQADCRTA
jgi:hypothetical protein